ncbi:MAG: GspE/PulE family protein [Planctomycetota bacterium]
MGFAGCEGPITAGQGLEGVLLTTKLLFDPIRLFILIAWLYLCMYFVQRVQFSALISKRFKSIANVITLFLGPVLLFICWAVDFIIRYRKGRHGVVEMLRKEWDKAVSGVKSIGFYGSRGRSSIMLLDSAGRSLAEVYAQGKDRANLETAARTEQIILDAIQQRSSDILIDPKDENTYSLRFRIDGMLRSIEQIPTSRCNAIVNSIKAIAGMDISEKRRPLDGGFTARIPEGIVSFRVASAGVLYGEKLSIRVLNPITGLFSLDDLGLSPKQREIFDTYINKPSGVILTCGPTGSGKSTTLYAMLNQIDSFTRNIITVEDPIEYVISNVSQIEINPRADITFAKALRSILRQDPDVICIGEIRDEETAAIAMQASQTGHLVLATLHSNSNVSALVRLLDLGIKPLLLSSALTVVISQRLVRKLCDRCKKPLQMTQLQYENFRAKGYDPAKIYDANGCSYCDRTGYHSRLALYDILVVDDKVRNSIFRGNLSAAELTKWGDEKGKSNLQKEGMKKVCEGLTTIAEVKRVTSDR